MPSGTSLASSTSCRACTRKEKPSERSPTSSIMANQRSPPDTWKLKRRWRKRWEKEKRELAKGQLEVPLSCRWATSCTIRRNNPAPNSAPTSNVQCLLRFGAALQMARESIRGTSPSIHIYVYIQIPKNVK
ncbi:uncharacterized protein LOC119559680 isoform X2 [Drosophila subpulchrella]|uniref:uncharacterized protein LOC119559680 isoform X2 n=1 Tax=Drosophila subpulchrella TaxID=1486046 RepID=UPI0018A15E70|nr:uncharacterized protein LOC119559680 isoform X2 [Drosophila subpulchrella]